MRWWIAGLTVAGLVALAACGASSGDASSAESSPTPVPTSPSTSPSTTPSPSPTSTPSTPPPSAPASSPSTATGNCVAGHVQVTVSPGDSPVRQLCVRPGTVVSLVLEPRVDDRRWTAVHSSAAVFVVADGWRVDVHGTARATLRCAGTRGGKAKVTALAKAPDVAGAARAVFTLDMSVVPYPKEG
ncbi:hypothetical protein LXH13_36895 [Streptomyces spinosirectus]|uniref:hypothetical protein n=1 Tax=Streptomyces TaxID=1883 RepID=UPI000D47EB94|nr:MULTISPECIES: hypothetical protein [Streptomyces]PTM90055.1 hypothetical protein C7821_112268 [Streptomyces sp. VMFN-G11Ma]UIR22274.1 hypothetical protein LXH13_36895 [Streptomyces spinosirectus]